MKNILYIFIFGVISICYGQNTLSIDFEPETDYFGSDYHLYKNDTLIYTNCTIKNDFKILFELEKGNYILKYDTVFGIDSLAVSFISNFSYRNVLLETENIAESKLANTHSEIESLKENEQITLKYSLGGCFVAKDYQLTLIKLNNKYYDIKNSRNKRISQKKVSRIIRYEKKIKNLNFDKNLDGFHRVVTCSEYISLEKNNEIIYSKNIYCGTWTESSELVKWIK